MCTIVFQAAAMQFKSVCIIAKRVNALCGHRDGLNTFIHFGYNRSDMLLVTLIGE